MVSPCGEWDRLLVGCVSKDSQMIRGERVQRWASGCSESDHEGFVQSGNPFYISAAFSKQIRVGSPLISIHHLQEYQIRITSARNRTTYSITKRATSNVKNRSKSQHEVTWT